MTCWARVDEFFFYQLEDVLKLEFYYVCHFFHPSFRLSCFHPKTGASSQCFGWLSSFHFEIEFRPHMRLNSKRSWAETSQALGLLFWFDYLFTIEIRASFFSWPLARFPFSCRGKVLSKDQLKLLDPLVGLTQQVQPWWSSVFNIDLIKHQRKYKIWKPSVSFPEVEWQIAWNFQPLQPWVETIRISDQRQPSKISHGNGSTGKKVNNTRPVEKEYVFLG